VSELQQLDLQLVSPEKLFYSRSVDMVIISGSEGDFGVLPGHAPIVSSIRPGLLVIHDDDKVEKLFLTGGVVEVLSNQVSILANEIYKMEDINVADIQNEIQAFKERLRTVDNEKEKISIELQISKLEAKIESTKL
jgi:F-type H+-transporting ATPase subunit epsilon